MELAGKELLWDINGNDRDLVAKNFIEAPVRQITMIWLHRLSFSHNASALLYSLSELRCTLNPRPAERVFCAVGAPCTWGRRSAAFHALRTDTSTNLLSSISMVSIVFSRFH